jgi:hypothetical protein
MKRKIYSLFVCAGIIFSVFCGKVNAESQTHDGFFIRLAPGIGASSITEEFGNDEAEFDGASTLFNFAIGGAIAENLILQLDVSGLNISDPDVTINGQDIGSLNGDVSTSLVGIGLTYYFPTNFYLTGAIGVASSEIETNGQIGETDNGYGINLMIGKEWWVSDNWGLGVAGQLLYTSCPDKPVNGVEGDVNTTSVGLLFSATYN